MAVLGTAAGGLGPASLRSSEFACERSALDVTKAVPISDFALGWISVAMDAVVLDQVTKRFDTVTAVSHLDLRVKQGTIFGLLGPNGAGKNTTLRMILRVLVPDEG